MSRFISQNDRQIENSRGRRMYPDEPLRETTINQIKTWLTECTTPGLKYSHERCERTRTMELGSTNRSHLPKRLLFIEAERKLILQRTSSCQADLRYATLSHCWGTESEASLWRQTSISDDGTVDLASAPKLLADMMKLLWTLGLHYFWVDALCIDQNSETEWLQESIRMSDIYRRGFLNISATSSKHGGEGLFHPKACTTRIMLGAVSPSWKADLSFTPFPEAVWDRQVKQAKLSKRGWVLQERLFSPRILHFCSGEILWECQSCRSGEMMESFSPPRDLKAILVDPDHDLSNRGFDKQQLKSYRAWDLLVETYSNMRLTKPSDKLVAIAGVASHLANFLRLDSSNYVAGHWRDGLPESLLWHCRNGEIVSGRAPSWSWAKFDGPVDFFWNPLWSFHCKIVAICADERSDAFVAGSSHWIKARCPLAILDFTKKVQKNSAERSIWSKVVGKRDNTRGRTNPFITAPWKIEWEEEFSGTIAANHWYYALCMSSGVDSEGLAACEGLVITPTRCSKGQFKRVGSFKLQLPSIETIAIYGKDVALVPEEMYISFDANDGFEIELL